MKLLIKTSCLIMALSSLSGCANINTLFGPTPEQIKAQKIAQAKAKRLKLIDTCNAAPLLYTNLKLPAQKRIYSLPEGNSSQVCPGSGESKP